jgi:NAD(P)-dependent dehydrogenase (short-subunit alcohol dehydrogenase family)
VAICARSADEVRRAEDAIREHGGTVFAAVADVTRPDEVEAFVAAAAEALGGIDVLVNNAGAAHPGTFEHSPTRPGRATST